MKIFIDDGSTNIKLAWLEDGDVKTLISPNSFKPEWSFSLLDDAAPANYEIDGEKFSFDPLSADAVVTTETRYQYSDVNVVAIQHALQQTGLKAQPVDVIVTLPISEYLDANNQKNKQNIERKKKNVMREVRVLYALRIHVITADYHPRETANIADQRYNRQSIAASYDNNVEPVDECATGSIDFLLRSTSY